MVEGGGVPPSDVAAEVVRLSAQPGASTLVAAGRAIRAPARSRRALWRCARPAGPEAPAVQRLGAARGNIKSCATAPRAPRVGGDHRAPRGKWLPEEKRIVVEAAFPIRALDTGDDVFVNVEMDPASELQIRAVIAQRELRVVGWYHSHPTFQTDGVGACATSRTRAARVVDHRRRGCATRSPLSAAS